MKTARWWCVVPCTLALLVGAAPSFASQAAVAARLAQQPTELRGELLRVDTKARTLTIKAADQTEVSFRYTDKTEVTGTEENVAGLATMKGAEVTVHFLIEPSGQSGREPGKEPTRTATKIEVHPRQ